MPKYRVFDPKTDLFLHPKSCSDSQLTGKHCQHIVHIVGVEPGPWGPGRGREPPTTVTSGCNGEPQNLTDDWDTQK